MPRGLRGGAGRGRRSFLCFQRRLFCLGAWRREGGREGETELAGRGGDAFFLSHTQPPPTPGAKNRRLAKAGKGWGGGEGGVEESTPPSALLNCHRFGKFAWPVVGVPPLPPSCFSWAPHPTSRAGCFNAREGLSLGVGFHCRPRNLDRVPLSRCRAQLFLGRCRTVPGLRRPDPKRQPISPIPTKPTFFSCLGNPRA